MVEHPGIEFGGFGRSEDRGLCTRYIADLVRRLCHGRWPIDNLKIMVLIVRTIVSKANARFGVFWYFGFWKTVNRLGALVGVINAPWIAGIANWIELDKSEKT